MIKTDLPCTTATAPPLPCFMLQNRSSAELLFDQEKRSRWREKSLRMVALKLTNGYSPRNWSGSMFSDKQMITEPKHTIYSGMRMSGNMRMGMMAFLESLILTVC